jgi:hypothetical protein
MRQLLSQQLPASRAANSSPTFRSSPENEHRIAKPKTPKPSTTPIHSSQSPTEQVSTSSSQYSRKRVPTHHTTRTSDFEHLLLLNPPAAERLQSAPKYAYINQVPFTGTANQVPFTQVSMPVNYPPMTVMANEYEIVSSEKGQAFINLLRQAKQDVLFTCRVFPVAPSTRTTQVRANLLKLGMRLKNQPAGENMWWSSNFRFLRDGQMTEVNIRLDDAAQCFIGARLDWWCGEHGKDRWSLVADGYYDPDTVIAYSLPSSSDKPDVAITWIVTLVGRKSNAGTSTAGV